MIERRGPGARAALRASSPSATAGSPRAPRRSRRAAGSARRRSRSGCPRSRRVNREEVFGPLLVGDRASRDVDEACDVVDVAARSRSPAACSRATPRPSSACAARLPVGQPLREPRHHRGDGGPPAVRRQPPLGHRGEGGRARLPAAVHRAARGDREHDATGNTRGVDGKEVGHDRSNHPRPPGRLYREGPDAGQGPRRVLRHDPAGPGRVAGRVLPVHGAARHRRRPGVRPRRPDRRDHRHDDPARGLPRRARARRGPEPHGSRPSDFVPLRA